jgi:cytochrome c oxidase subunit III
MEIPYAVKAHPVTGIANGKLGIWLFLASEVMLFGALFSSYVLLRVGADVWPHGRDVGLSVPLATLNTMVLIASSVTMVMSWASLKMNEFGKFRMYLGITILLSFVFLIIKYFEYSAKFHHDIYPSTSTFFAIYFTLTGLHGLHVIGGIVVNGYLIGPGSKLWKQDPDRFTNRIEYAGLYWHFVDLVWIFLFPVLYLL